MVGKSAAIEVIRGQTLTIRFLLQDLDAEPLPIAGSTVVLTVTPKVGDDTVILSKSTANAGEGVIIDPGGGGVTAAELYIEPDDTTAVEPGCYTYDAWIDNLLEAGDHYPLVRAAFDVVEPARRWS